MTKITLLPAPNYIQDVTHAIKNAKKCVYIVSLAISDDPLTHDLMTNLIDAAKRGIETNIAVDEFTFSEFGGYFNPLKRWHARSQAAAKLASQFVSAGATFRWLGGNYKINPFAGVTHIKWCVVDDIVYSFGGVNLYQESVEWTDYMLKLTDHELAEALTTQQLKIAAADESHQPYAGFSKSLSFGHVYIDSGQRGHSIIYNRACELAAAAKKITFVSQYCPSGPLAQLLKDKHTTFYFNQPANASFYTRIFISLAMHRNHIRSLYQRKTYLHAKFILFDMPGGSKIALTGSHNFSHGGVSFGTREVALETTNKQICHQLDEFLQKNVT